MPDEAEELADCSISDKQEQKKPFFFFLEEAIQSLVHAQKWKDKDKFLFLVESQINTMTHASV